MDDLKIFIGGQWRHGGGNPMQSHFPADGSINATLNAASLYDLEEAVDAGERAWRDPAWRNSLPHMRAKILHNRSCIRLPISLNPASTRWRRCRAVITASRWRKRAGW